MDSAAADSTQLGVGEQAAGNAEPLAHPERVSLHAFVRPLGEADACERAVDPFVRLRLPRGCDQGEVLAAR